MEEILFSFIGFLVGAGATRLFWPRTVIKTFETVREVDKELSLPTIESQSTAPHGMPRVKVCFVWLDGRKEIKTLFKHSIDVDTSWRGKQFRYSKTYKNGSLLYTEVKV